MKAPDKIYIFLDGDKSWYTEKDYISQPPTSVQYIHKDVVDETIKTAEDHAYFAGQEKFREKLLKCINEIRAIPHDNAIARDLTFQEIINKINSI